MTRKKYGKRIAAAAGSLAGLTALPAVAEAGVVTVTGSPVSLATSTANGTSVTWDIDGDGNSDFRLHNFYGTIMLASNVSVGVQGQGRGIVAPFATDNVQALQASFNVGPTLPGGYQFGRGAGGTGSASNGLYNYRNAMSSGGAIGYDFNYGFAPGDNFFGFRFQDPTNPAGQLNYGFGVINFDTTNGVVTISKWAYETVVDTPIHVEPIGSAAVPEPGSLALLALGAAGVMAYRSRRREAGDDAASNQLSA